MRTKNMMDDGWIAVSRETKLSGWLITDARS